MIKIFKYQAVQLFLFSFLFCGPGEEVGEGNCLPPELIITNNSGYTAGTIYMHDSINDYFSGQVLAEDVPAGQMIAVDVSDGLVKYFTFIRTVTSTIDTEIAVTTASPVTFNNCYKYILYLLAEDFFLEDSENYSSYKFFDD